MRVRSDSLQDSALARILLESLTDAGGMEFGVVAEVSPIGVCPAEHSGLETDGEATRVEHPMVDVLWVLECDGVRLVREVPFDRAGADRLKIDEDESGCSNNEDVVAVGRTVQHGGSADTSE